MMVGRDWNGVVSVCLYSKNKKKASRSPNGSDHTLECPQSAQQRSACPGSVQAHFPLGALMEKFSEFHLWHHSLQDRFQPPLTFKWRGDLQAALRHADPPAERRLLEWASDSNYCEEISLAHFTCAWKKSLIWRIRKRSSPWGSQGREQSRASEIGKTRSQSRGGPLEVVTVYTMSSVCPSISLPDLKREKKNKVMDGIRHGGVGDALVKINISSVKR